MPSLCYEIKNKNNDCNCLIYSHCASGSMIPSTYQTPHGRSLLPVLGLIGIASSFLGVIHCYPLPRHQWLVGSHLILSETALLNYPLDTVFDDE